MQPSPMQTNGSDAAQGAPNHAYSCSQLQLSGFIIRFVAIVATFIATIVMAVNKETEVVLLNGDLLNLTIKSTGPGASQLEYFIAVNAIAFAYSSGSLALSILNRRSSAKNLMLLLTIVDLVMVAFLFSGIGSASAIAVLARDGAGVLWGSFCDPFGKFCSNMAAAIVMSMFGAVAFLSLVVASYVGLHV